MMISRFSLRIIMSETPLMGSMLGRDRPGLLSSGVTLADCVIRILLLDSYMGGITSETRTPTTMRTRPLTMPSARCRRAAPKTNRAQSAALAELGASASS